MKRQPWGLYAIALAIGLVGLVVPASTLLVAALALACPLMMISMMGGMHGGHGQAQHSHAPTTTSTHPRAGNGRTRTEGERR